eukprot:Stramenopile-MAST_4_protein_1656
MTEFLHSDEQGAALQIHCHLCAQSNLDGGGGHSGSRVFGEKKKLTGRKIEKHVHRLLLKAQQSKHWDKFTKIARHSVLTFTPADWPGLRGAIALQLSCREVDFGHFHKIENSRGNRPKKNSQRTKGKRSNPVALQMLRDEYTRFVCDFVAPHLASEDEDILLSGLVFQSMPALRVAPPSEVAIGTRHRDADYRHQSYQINFWVPLCPAFGNDSQSNTLWVNGLKDWPDVPLDSDKLTNSPLNGDFGVVHRFYGNGLFHQTYPNNTNATRISLDFRVVPGYLYDNDWPGSRNGNGKQCFFLGGYYRECKFDHESGKWQAQECET